MGNPALPMNNCSRQAATVVENQLILSYLYSIVRKARREKLEVYGARVNGGTLPPDILVTASRPDLVLVDRSTTPCSVELVELTVP